ncbi:iron-containing redox enzyme family protein [Actinotalea sp. C106]|uniref:iron-containing redox enzyme family protein n=1 Tax=Actinotalea sp. C106 TaxID=2908644 RepID=UPI002027CCAD|nr:iron-containing redox enzyme family protein [Actinotalea sp. C106]
MRRPTPRGPLSTHLLAVLDGAPGPAPALVEAARTAAASSRDVVEDEDVQLTLLSLYELHYRGIDGVDDAWEWHPDLIAARGVLEEAFEAELRARVPVPQTEARTADEIARALFELTSAEDGPSLARHIARRATAEQVDEFAMHRSIYHLKEADPHSWALPRLTGRPKSALVEIQADEYGGGRPGYVHAELFGSTLRAMGLDDHDGTYLDRVPASTLASVTMMSMFGLNRRLRGAITGHLAAFEMTSSVPNRHLSNGFRRVGHGPEVTAYFDEHVEADAVHEQIAGRDLAGALAEDEPALREDVLWGAAACLAVDGLAGRRILEAWERGESSLRPVPAAAAA